MSRSIPLSLWDAPMPLRRIDPACIRVRRVPVDVVVDYQRRMSRAIWRPAPGRKLGFIVEHKDDLIALLFLASPVINLACRDAYLGLSKDPSERGAELRHYADLSVCVGAQPTAWYWNIGKLGALLATTLGDTFRAVYDNDLYGIVTTSLYGRGSQYNRVYRHLGYTKGYGHEHVSDDDYRRMLRWMRTNGAEVPSSRFGSGSNPRMRRIAAYRAASGNKSVTLQHGHLRAVYYHPAQDPSDRPAVIRAWYERWGMPRYQRVKDRKPPYENGYTHAVAASSDAPTFQVGEGGSQLTLPLHIQDDAA